MHVIAVRQGILDHRPELAHALHLGFERAKQLARAEDPRIPMLAWHSAAWEHQRLILGPDPWAYGLTTTNRHNLETLIKYAHDQELITRVITSDDLFGAPA
jgi:4,5-dihydroxyphthalate decarboxylase